MSFLSIKTRIPHFPTVQLLKSLSFVCGVWFVCTSWNWAHFTNVWHSYPVGLVGMLIWSLTTRKCTLDWIGRVTLVLHVIGLFNSLTVLVYFRFFHALPPHGMTANY